MKTIVCWYFLGLFTVSIASGRVRDKQIHYTRTEMGMFTGYVDWFKFMRKTGHVISYLGIPYAESPTGWKRLRKPRFHERMEWVYNATVHQPACLQLKRFGNTYPTDEDCLFLNIYAPIESTINPKKRFPVLIYIHGGGFVSGSARDVSPEVFVLASDVIVVTLNYRLGVFGFFSSGYDTYGNYGLWDQHFAIKWIRYNIASFGGDVHKITVMGQEAGAASALYQAMYPGNRGLFHRVIAIDGSSMSPWALKSSRAGHIGLYAKCFGPEDNVIILGNQSLAECVRNASYVDLLKAGGQVGNIGPTIDGEFIMEHPFNILYPHDNRLSDALDFFRSLDVIIGVVEKREQRKLFEILATRQGDLSNKERGIDRNVFEEIVVPENIKPLYEHWGIMHGYPILPNIRAKIDKAVTFKYTNWTDPYNQSIILNNSLTLSNDVNFIVPAVHAADAHILTTENASTYMVQIAHAPLGNKPDDVMYPDALYIFSSSSMVNMKRTNDTEWQRNHHRQTITWIQNFVYNGDPNSPNSTTGFKLPFKWGQYDQNRTYLHFNSNSSVRQMFGEPATTFWTSLVPVLLQDNTTFTVLNPVPFGLAESIYIATFRMSAKLAEYLIVSLIVGSSLLLLLLFAVTCIICQMRTRLRPVTEHEEKMEHEIQEAFQEN